MKRCAACRRSVPDAAIRCPHCQAATLELVGECPDARPGWEALIWSVLTVVILYPALSEVAHGNLVSGYLLTIGTLVSGLVALVKIVHSLRVHATALDSMLGLGGLALIGISGLLFLRILLPPPGAPVGSRSLSNIRQLGLAVQQYANDNGEVFPGWMDGPDGRPVHNCWDEQIVPFFKAKDVFFNGDTGIRSSFDPAHQRVLTYGLNGLLIAKDDGQGNADWSKGPRPQRSSDLEDPANTILLAELATEQSPAAIDPRYGHVEGAPVPNLSSAFGPFRHAHTGWIDIDPRAWVEQGRGADAYDPERWGDTAKRGVTRDKYGGGGVYAFCDGHVAYLKLSRTTTSGQSMSPEMNWALTKEEALQINMWLPYPKKAVGSRQ